MCAFGAPWRTRQVVEQHNTIIFHFVLLFSDQCTTQAILREIGGRKDEGGRLRERMRHGETSHRGQQRKCRVFFFFTLVCCVGQKLFHCLLSNKF